MSKAVKPEAPQKVDYNDAVAESKKYFDGDDLAATVWVSKYALKDSFGNIYETSPRQMHERIAAEIERIERKYPNPMSREEVFGLLDHFRYVIPQGGPMTGIGNNFQVASLSNCFVIGHKHPADSYGGIFRMDEEQVQLMNAAGAWGMTSRTSVPRAARCSTRRSRRRVSCLSWSAIPTRRARWRRTAAAVR